MYFNVQCEIYHIMVYHGSSQHIYPSTPHNKGNIAGFRGVRCDAAMRDIVQPPATLSLEQDEAYQLYALRTRMRSHFFALDTESKRPPTSF